MDLWTFLVKWLTYLYNKLKNQGIKRAGVVKAVYKYDFLFSMNSILTSPRTVFSMRPFTLRANSGSKSFSKWAVMIGVLIFLLAFMISLILYKQIQKITNWLKYAVQHNLHIRKPIECNLLMVECIKLNNLMRNLAACNDRWKNMISAY